MFEDVVMFNLQPLQNAFFMFKTLFWQRLTIQSKTLFQLMHLRLLNLTKGRSHFRWNQIPKHQNRGTIHRQAVLQMLGEICFVIVLQIFKRWNDDIFLLGAWSIFLHSFLIFLCEFWGVDHCCFGNQGVCNAFLVSFEVYLFKRTAIFILIANVLPYLVLERNCIHFLNFN